MGIVAAKLALAWFHILLLPDLTFAHLSFAVKSDNQALREAPFRQEQRIDEGELEMLRTTEDSRGIVDPSG